MKNLKNWILGILVFCTGFALSTDVDASPIRPVIGASCSMIQSDIDPDGWVYSLYFSNTVFKGTLLCFGIHSYGTPDTSNQEIYFGGLKVPREEVQIAEKFQEGPEKYWYEIIVPIKYAKYGAINIPVRGIVGGGTLYKSTDARDRGNKLGSQYL